MSNDVIGSRYRLGMVVTCTPETTTWDARDTWLEERVLVVTPEPGCDKRFAALAGAVLDRSSPHLVGLYDIGTTTSNFVVFGAPAATSATAARQPALPTTTTEPPSTTTSSVPSTSSTTSTTTTEVAPTTTTTTPPSTTTSTSANEMQAGPSLPGSWSGQSPGGAPGTGPGH